MRITYDNKGQTFLLKKYTQGGSMQSPNIKKVLLQWLWHACSCDLLNKSHTLMSSQVPLLPSKRKLRRVVKAYDLWRGGQSRRDAISNIVRGTLFLILAGSRRKQTYVQKIKNFSNLVSSSWKEEENITSDEVLSLNKIKLLL